MTQNELITKVYELGFEAGVYSPNPNESYLIIWESDHELASINLNTFGSFSLRKESPAALDTLVIAFAQTPLNER